MATHEHVDTTRALHGAGWVATVLVIIGALNWGLVGLFRFNLVAAIFGADSVLTRIIYVLVGLAGLYMIYFAVQLSRETKPVGVGRAIRPTA